MNTSEQKNFPLLIESDIGSEARAICLEAKKLEESGNFDEALEVMAPLWNGDQINPDLESARINKDIRAEIMLRAGVLCGWIGDKNSIPESQEKAKDLIDRARRIFEDINHSVGIAECQIEAAYCYWREGAFEEAVALLLSVGGSLIKDDVSSRQLKALACIRLAIFEQERKKYDQALEVLKSVESLVSDSQSHSIKGKYHNELAQIFQSMAKSTQSEEISEEALTEYLTASFHFQEAGFKRYCGMVENNIGWLLFEKKRYEEALDHLDYAKKIGSSIKENSLAATADENRACVYLELGKTELAEQLSRRSIAVFEKAERYSWMADSLITNGKALARLGRFALARQQFERSEMIAAQRVTSERAGLAVLALMEELQSRLSIEELRQLYLRADSYFYSAEDPETQKRLLKNARLLIENMASVKAPAEKIEEVPSLPQAEKNLDDLIREAEVRFRKSVKFTLEAIEAIQKFYFADNSGKLQSIIEHTVKQAENDVVITSDAVEIVALRNSAEVDFSHPWENLSLRDFTHGIEKRFIELALKEANGSITKAGSLLGFKHYEMLNSIIKTRHPDLLAHRIPPVKRKRSIIKKSKKV